MHDRGENLCAGILGRSMGVRNRVEIGLSYLPIRQQGWQNRFLGSLKVYRFRLWRVNEKTRMTIPEMEFMKVQFR
jgi:hypothetical protein